MACGDKYRYLLRTASGLEADRPCLAFCNEKDFADWFERVHEIGALVNERWASLRKLEIDRGQGTPLSDSVRDAAGAYFEAASKLPDPYWTMFSILPEQKVGQALAVGEMGLCQIETIDDAAASLGEQLPEIHGPRAPKVRPGGVLDSLQTVAMLGVVGVGLYFAGRYVIRTQRKQVLSAN